MTIKVLRLAICQMLSSSAPDDFPESDWVRFNECLTRLDALTVEQFCEKCSAIKVPKPVKTKAMKPVSVLDESLVTSYLVRLRSDTKTRAECLDIAAELGKDAKAKAPEVARLAGELLRTQQKFGKKSDAIDAIIAWVHRRFDTQRRLSNTGDIF
jgi:hypothetical protein